MPASTAQRAKTATRRAAAIQMKLSGADFEEIADTLEYANAKAASKDVWRAMKAAQKLEAARVTELRQVQFSRLERMHAETWPLVTNTVHCEDCEAGRIDPASKLKAIETTLKIGAEMRKLLGLDQPTVTQITGPGGGRLELEVPQLNELEALIKAVGDPAPGKDADGRED